MPLSQNLARNQVLQRGLLEVRGGFTCFSEDDLVDLASPYDVIQASGARVAGGTIAWVGVITNKGSVALQALYGALTVAATGPNGGTLPNAAGRANPAASILISLAPGASIPVSPIAAAGKLYLPPVAILANDPHGPILAAVEFKASGLTPVRIQSAAGALGQITFSHGALSGVIIDITNGRKIAGCGIYIDNVLAATTAADGTYLISSLESGVHNWQARATGYQNSAVLQFQITPGATYYGADQSLTPVAAVVPPAPVPPVVPPTPPQGVQLTVDAATAMQWPITRGSLIKIWHFDGVKGEWDLFMPGNAGAGDLKTLDYGATYIFTFSRPDVITTPHGVVYSFNQGDTTLVWKGW